MHEKRQLLSIGEASKITGMHVKSLRYYDKIVLTTISLHSNRSEPMYSMYINLTEE